MNQEVIIGLVILAIAVGIFTICFMYPVVILKVLFGLGMVALIGYLVVRWAN
ncbi:hypothetical protein ACWIUD_01335 [Helicobacter sp. 23-1044]